MSTLGERIKYIRGDILKLNQSAFADMLGFSRGATISDYEKNKRSPDISTLCKIADIGIISIDWLLTGNGPATHQGADGETICSKTSKEQTNIHRYKGDYISLDVYDKSAGESLKDFPAGDPVDTIYIPQRDSCPGMIAIRIEGDSMSPTIVDNATVCIDTDDCEPVSGKLFAVWLDHEKVTVKRLYVYPDHIELRPDNKNFPTTTIPALASPTQPASLTQNDTFIIGKVKVLYQKY